MRRPSLAAVLAVLVLALAAASADAAPVLVLGHDGEVRTRHDPLLPPPDPLPQAGRRSTAAPAVARTAAARPTVRSELIRQVDEGRLAPEEGLRLRGLYAQARATLKGLTGTRRTQLAAVIANVDRMARGRLLAVGRLPAVFLTLERNRAWWAAAPLPAAGQRVTFADSDLVWQYYPGQGLQIQWLGTFGKANGLFQMGKRDKAMGALLDEALSYAVPRAGGLAFESYFTFNGGRPPWVSGLSQGTALSALARAAVRLKDPRYLDAARAALGIFQVPPPEGVRVDTPVGAHYLQYSYAKDLHIANGFVQALNGLHDFGMLAGDEQGQALFLAGEAQLRAELPAFDTGAWSLYAIPGGESELGYHTLLRDFLRGLCTRLQDDLAAQVPMVIPDPTPYCATADRFTADLTTPPALQLQPVTLRPKREGKISFTLSKVSTVSLQVLRAGEVVLSSSGRFGHGTQSFAITPRKSGPLEIRLHATDLAGNGADAVGTTEVRRGGAAPAVSGVPEAAWPSRAIRRP